MHVLTSPALLSKSTSVKSKGKNSPSLMSISIVNVFVKSVSALISCIFNTTFTAVAGVERTNKPITNTVNIPLNKCFFKPFLNIDFFNGLVSYKHFFNLLYI